MCQGQTTVVAAAHKTVEKKLKAIQSREVCLFQPEIDWKQYNLASSWSAKLKTHWRVSGAVCWQPDGMDRFVKWCDGHASGKKNCLKPQLHLGVTVVISCQSLSLSHFFHRAILKTLTMSIWHQFTFTQPIILNINPSGRGCSRVSPENLNWRILQQAPCTQSVASTNCQIRLWRVTDVPVISSLCIQ